MATDTLTSSLLPLKQFPNPPIHPPTLEVEEFCSEDGTLAHPFTTYINHLYVYPKMLKFDSQKAFPKVNYPILSQPVPSKNIILELYRISPFPRCTILFSHKPMPSKNII